MEHKNPWLSIWTEPRATIAQIVKHNPNRSIWWLAAIYGFCSLMNLFQSMTLGKSMGMVGILILAVLVAPFYGYISFSVWSLFVYWTGKLFKGKGGYKEVRASYAWSCVPVIVNVPLWILMVVIFGNQVFLNFPNAHQMPTTQVFILFVILIVKVIVAIWSLVIFLNALSQVQNYSVIRAILNVVLAGVVLGLIFFALWTLLLYAFGAVAMSPYLLLKP